MPVIGYPWTDPDVFLSRSFIYFFMLCSQPESAFRSPSMLGLQQYFASRSVPLLYSTGVSLRALYSIRLRSPSLIFPLTVSPCIPHRPKRTLSSLTDHFFLYVRVLGSFLSLLAPVLHIGRSAQDHLRRATLPSHTGARLIPLPMGPRIYVCWVTSDRPFFFPICVLGSLCTIPIPKIL